MAYYSSSYSDSNFGAGEYYYHSQYDDGSHEFFSSEASEPHSSYAYNGYNYNYNSVEYDPAPYYGDYYDSDISHSTIAYSSNPYACSEPKYVDYGLDPYGGDYATVKTRFIMSYSVLELDDGEFNMPLFKELDPTPYGGGYDPDATYGKPLPPSEAVCYPPSSADPNDIPLSNYGSIESPYGKDAAAVKPVAKPSNGGKKVRFKDQEEQVDNVGSKGKPADSFQGEEIKENYPDGAIESGNTENEIRVYQIPPGYGLEAMDLCESLFGYWPCLARAKRERECQNCQEVYSKASNDNWLGKGTADYLFGSSYPYGERWSIGVTSSIQDLLKSQGLPGGLFPDNVKSYELDRDGRLEVHLERPCMAKFDGRVHFDRVVRANLSYGGLMGLEGLSQEELFLWLPVKGIIVNDPSSGLILFDIGVAHKQLSLSLFENPPVCKPQEVLAQKVGRKNKGFQVLR
ncbi:hypothetical protein COLO4_31668 [Corchorus olitorius]|uniref:Uncharacterized protein n=1 Tax=Corchorus olitorius TaxID=93759 RepID=A0A1R3H3R0_9ROSI|nr:hypothetical protein COLO4_31668 [Corchorus olitorius]